MKFPVSIFSLVILTLTASFAQDKEAAPKTTNLPPDPFGDLEPVPVIPDYAMKVDRTRGLMTSMPKTAPTFREATSPTGIGRPTQNAGGIIM